MLADLAARAPALRGRALGAQQAAAALGIAIGAPLGGVVSEAYGELAHLPFHPSPAHPTGHAHCAPCFRRLAVRCSCPPQPMRHGHR